MTDYANYTTDELISLLDEEEGYTTEVFEEIIRRSPETSMEWEDIKLYSTTASDPEEYVSSRLEYYLQMAVAKLGYEVEWEELYYDPDEEEEEYTRRFWAVSFSWNGFRPNVHIFANRGEADAEQQRLRELAYDTKVYYLCGTSDVPEAEDNECEWAVIEIGT